MKFQPDQFGSAITSYGPGWIAIGGQRLEHSVVLHSTGEHALWACAGFDELTENPKLCRNPKKPMPHSRPSHRPS